MFAGILLKGEAGDIPGIISFVATTSNPKNVTGKLSVAIVTGTMSR
jgi:hypothetical protein